jgi:dihydroflavonol-4-reductase
MLDRAAVRRALQGARFLIHVAADYRLWARDPEEIVRTNRDGTAIVMEEARAAGVERIVYTSSVATLALSPDGVPADESRRLAVEDAVGAYKKSKVLAERAVEAMIAEKGLPAVIVHPSTPIGPRDIKPTPTGRIIVEAASGKMPGYVDTGLNLVHVDDVARGHLLALDRGAIGGHYILGGENVLLGTMLADIAAIVGRRPPKLEFPRKAIYPIALAAEAVAAVTGREPFVTRDGLRMAKYRMFFDDRKARTELGYTSRPYREALVDAIAWFRQAGYLT